MTREQFAKLLVLTKNFTPDPSVDTAFADNLDANQWWYFSYVQAAQRHGLVIGMGDGRFGVGDTLTREQAVPAIVHAAGLEGEVDPNAVPTFADTEQISPRYVALAQQKGLVLGMEGNTFQGSVTTTREMAVQMLYRYLQAAEEATPAPETPAPETPAPETGDSDVAPSADDANSGSTDDSASSDQTQAGTPVPPENPFDLE